LNKIEHSSISFFKQLLAARAKEGKHSFILKLEKGKGYIKVKP